MNVNNLDLALTLKIRTDGTYVHTVYRINILVLYIVITLLNFRI